MSDSLFTWPLLVLLACFIAAAILWMQVRSQQPTRVIALAQLEQLLETMRGELALQAEHEWNDTRRHLLEGRIYQINILIDKVQRGVL